LPQPFVNLQSTQKRYAVDVLIGLNLAERRSSALS